MNGLQPRDHDPDLPRLLVGETLRVPTGENLCAMLRDTLAQQRAPLPVSARLLWARWKPRTALSTVHAVACEDGVARLVTVRQHRGRKSGGRVHSRSAELAAPWLPAGVASDGTVLTVWPQDSELPGLARALDIARLSRLVEDGPLGEGGSIRRRRSSFETLRYKPSRRAVLRLDLVLRDADERLFTRHAILRVLTPDAAAASVRERAKLPDGFAPKVLLHEDTTGMVVEEFVPAKVAETVDEALDRVAMERVVALREALERTGESFGEQWIEDETESLSSLLEIDPATHARAARILARNARRRVRLARVHGDYHPGQIAYAADGRVLVYDWDECRVDEIATDAATWAAERMRGKDAEFAEELLARLLDADRGLDERALRERVVMELVRRASGAVRRLELGARELAAASVDLAEKLQPGGAAAPVSGDLLLPALMRAGMEEEQVERVEVRKDGALVVTTADFGALLAKGRRVARFGLSEDYDIPAAQRMAQRVAAGEARIVSWRPGRRLVAAGMEHGVEVYWKCLKPGAAIETHMRHEMHRGALMAAGFRVPRLLSVDRAWDVCAFEAMGGGQWRPDDEAATKLVAQALRRWREAQPAGLAAVHDAQAELAVCQRFASRLLAAGANLDWSARRLLSMLPARVALDQSPRCNAHRDFYEKQVLVDGEHVVLLDLDLAGRSAPEQDPSNAALHMRLAAFLGECDGPRQQRCERAFLRELRVDTATAQWKLWTALNALRMALVHAPRPRTRHAVPYLLRIGTQAAEGLE